MHRLFIPPSQLGPRVALSPEQLRYARAVLRLEDGAQLEVFDGRGARFPAQLQGDALHLGPELPRAPVRAVDVTLAQALAKGDKLELVVQKATELGASRIVPLATERSVVRLDKERGEARAERYRRVAQEAARQCGRADVPEVLAPLSWDELFALCEPDRRAIVLDPGERALRLSEAARGVPRLLLIVGPEGGLTADERAAAQRAGAVAAGLGEWVLRTETAGLVALSVVRHVHGELG